MLRKIRIIRSFGVKNVVCSGAGVVGQSFAAALASNDFFKESEAGNIVMLDLKTPPNINHFLGEEQKNRVPDQRTYALSPTSIDFLRDLGILNKMNDDIFTEYQWMQVWEKIGRSYISFEGKQGRPLGRTVENDHLSGALYSKLQETNAVEFIVGDPLINAKRKRDEGIVELELKSGRKLETKLLVGSDGNNSAVKKVFNIATSGWSHKQRAIVCTVKVDNVTETLWQRFLETGPLALLSMWGDYCSIVWSVDEDLFEHLSQLSDDLFLEELNSKLHSDSQTNHNTQLHDMMFTNYKARPPIVTEICNKRMSFPLSTLSAQNYVGDNFALIGDAAHSIHPMAGQGLNLGLLDAEILANTICGSIRDGKQFETEDNMFRYEKKAKFNNYSMQTGVEALKVAYSLNTPIFSTLRNIGVEIIQNSPLRGVAQEVASGQQYRDTENVWKSQVDIQLTQIRVQYGL